MAATGTEAVQLSQLKTYADSVDTKINAKQDALTLPLTIANGGTGSTSAATARTALGAVAAPSGDGTSGQFLQTNGDGTTAWATVSQGTTYTGSNGITVSGSTISGVTAAADTVGVVSFASNLDFEAYMELS